VPGSKHSRAGRAPSLVLGEREGNRQPAVRSAALTGEVPAVLPGLDTLEPLGGLMNVRVDLEQDILLVSLLFFVTAGH